MRVQGRADGDEPYERGADSLLQPETHGPCSTGYVPTVPNPPTKVPAYLDAWTRWTDLLTKA